MENYSYPLLCWNLGEDEVFGLLLGTDLEALGSDVR